MTDGQRLEALELMEHLEYAMQRGFTETAIKDITNILKRLIDDKSPDVKDFQDLTFHIHSGSPLHD